VCVRVCVCVSVVFMCVCAWFEDVCVRVWCVIVCGVCVRGGVGVVCVV